MYEIKTGYIPPMVELIYLDADVITASGVEEETDLEWGGALSPL